MKETKKLPLDFQFAALIISRRNLAGAADACSKKRLAVAYPR